MTIDQWVRFWFGKSFRYHAPPPRKDKKLVRPKSTHNPLGDFNAHESWSVADKNMFLRRSIKDSSMEGTYFAAYLSVGYVHPFFLVMMPT